VVSKVKLSDLGERKVVDIVRGILADTSQDQLGLLDDCAAIDFQDDYLLITTDMINQSTHLPLGSPIWHVGWHLVAVNLSDIAAMGGVPIGVVLALGLPRSCDSEIVNALMEGANSCALKYDTSILGGDTKESETLTLSACALGKVSKSEILRRMGAKSGDIIYVTGCLGKAASGFYSLDKNPDDMESLKDLLEIQPRIAEGRALARSNLVTSCMDISDGLASSLYQMSMIGDVGFEIELYRVPKCDSVESIAHEMNVHYEELILYFGGDYELLVTVDEKGGREIERIMAQLGIRFTQIGRVGDNKGNTLIKDGVSTSLENRGYEHFRWNL
jgi:thiamine-monophosphate kinase